MDKHVKGKDFDDPLAIVLHIIQEFMVPGCSCKRKIDDKLKRQIIQMVTKEPKTTSKEIRGEIKGQSSSLSDYTIRHCLSQSGLPGR